MPKSNQERNRAATIRRKGANATAEERSWLQRYVDTRGKRGPKAGNVYPASNVARRPAPLPSTHEGQSRAAGPSGPVPGAIPGENEIKVYGPTVDDVFAEPSVNASSEASAAKTDPETTIGPPPVKPDMDAQPLAGFLVQDLPPPGGPSHGPNGHSHPHIGPPPMGPAGGPLPPGAIPHPDCPQCSGPTGNVCPHGHVYFTVSEDTGRLVGGAVVGGLVWVGGKIQSRSTGKQVKPAPMTPDEEARLGRAYAKAIQLRANAVGKWDDLLSVAGATFSITKRRMKDATEEERKEIS